MRKPRRHNNILKFSTRQKRRASTDRKSSPAGWQIYAFSFGVFLVVFLTGFAATRWIRQEVHNEHTSAFSQSFEICGLVRQTCVVDGDTIWLSGTKIRIADIDTPEISEPQCDSEYARGIAARDRLVELLNEGRFEVMPIGRRDEDSYGRKLRVLVRNGQSLGHQLVSENLARTWSGRREPWC